MKKTLIVMLSIIAVLFGFASCDNSASTPEGTAISNLGELKAAVAADGEYYLNADITLDGQLVISAPITLDGNNHKITATTPTTGDTAADKALILVTSDSVTLKNLTVSGTKTQETWNEGEYGIKVYDAENVTLEDITVTTTNAGIQVNGSTVILEGTTTVTGNTFGGIEVSKGAATPSAGTLTVNGTIVSTDTDVPAIWIDGNTDGNTVTGVEALTDFIPTTKQNQTWYITDAQRDAEGANWPMPVEEA